MNTQPVETILSRLAGVRKIRGGYTARCPAHDDQHASLSIRAEGERVLVKCFAGCEFPRICAALGLTPGDFFVSSSPETGATPQHPPPGCTVQAYADAKRLPLDFLKTIGLTDTRRNGVACVRIPYGPDGPVRFRTGLTGGDRFRWRSGSRPTLYGLWRLAGSKPQSLVLVEGESDAHTLWFHEIAALGLPGAAAWNEQRDAPHLDGISTVYVVVEPDAGGEAVKRWVSRSRLRERVRLVVLGEHKDVSALHLADSKRFRERWEAACGAAVSWTDLARQEADVLREAAWNICRELAHAPDILQRFTEALAHSGVTGETKTAKLIFLALVSRVLDRPVSVAVKGPSSGGKSFLVDKVLAFFPAMAYYALSAMSEHALAYSEEPLAHRFLVVFEATGLQGDFQSYLVRSLLSEGRIRYETVEKTQEGMKPRLIEREGPTGLIVTTTAIRLHPENETRLLSVTVSDTKAQTAAVLDALAEDGGQPVDLAPWRALAEWLAGGEHRVVIPYAKALAEQIPPVAVRLRRDFKAVLILIQAHALLHRASRAQDAQGRIVATLADYTAVRELVADLLAEGVGATVSPTVREAVEAVEELVRAAPEGVTVTALAKALRLDKASASRRQRTAVEAGYLRNLESVRGKPARLVLGDPLPEGLEILPDSTRLEDCCTVAPESERINQDIFAESNPPASPGQPATPSPQLSQDASRTVQLIQEVFPGTELCPAEDDGGSAPTAT